MPMRNRRKVRKGRIIAALIILITVFTFIFYSAQCATHSTEPPLSSAATASPPVVNNVPAEKSIYTKVDEYLKAYESKGWFSGSVLAAKKGEIIIGKGYGMANYELDVPNTANTKFHLGSITKQFTAMAVMQLQEKGKLSINDTLAKYIPDYPNGKKITVHHLLTHTSGIPDYINDDDTFSEICRLYHTLDKVIDRFKNKPLEFQPGTRYDYSNSGYLLLSYIIEKASGMPYEKFLHEYIFKPLNMKNTGYDHVTPIIKNRALGYSILDGRMTNAEFFDRSTLQGADGLYSTVEDLYLWERSLYTEKLVSKSTLDKIFTPYPPANIYGYGWTTNGVEMRHFGRMDGYYTFIFRNTANDTSIIVLSNIQQAPINIIGRDLIAILSGGEYKMPDNLVPVKISE